MIPPSPLAQDRLLETLPRDSQSRPLIGGIALTKRLGAGGMGAVYLGVQVAQRRNVAVKILPFNLLEQSPNALKRFEAEARLAAGLTSDHVVRVFDVGAEHRTHFIVMEYVPGDSAGGMVRKRIAAGKGPFSEGEALRIALGAAKGLAAAHGKGITHRDIKPDNILIPEGDLDRAKVADLGLAKPEEGSTTVGTMSHVAMGTPGYMAPEQAESAKGAGPAADVFALGGTIYTLLTGQPPFKGETLMAILRATVGEAPQPLPEGTSAGVKWLVDKALSKKPERRFADGTEFAAAIEKVIADPDDAPEEARRPGGLRRSMDAAARVDLRPGRKSPVAAVVVGVAVLVLAVAGLAIYRARGKGGDSSKSGTVSGAPGNPALDARFMEAGRLVAAGKREQLRRLLAEISTQAPGDPRIEAYADRLRELDQEGSRRETNAKVARMKADLPNTPELWDAAAQAAASLMEIADTDERRAAARALENEAMAHRDLALARLKAKAGDLAGALEDARKLADNPSLKDIGAYIASLETELKDREARESMARDFKAACAAAEKEQDPQKAMEIWKKALGLTSDLTEAARIGERIRALESPALPADAVAYETAMREGGELFGQKRLDEAEAACRRALALRPGDPKATEQLQRVVEARAGQEFSAAAAAAAEAEARGDWAGVKAAAVRMAAAKPGDPAAARLLAEAKKHLAGPEPVTPVVNKGRFSVVLDASRDLKMDFVVLPHATVTIGDGTETRRATLTKDFAVATTEVTQDQWMELMPWNPSHHPGGSFPVEFINWFDALAFCDALSARLVGWTATLPTNAQWQYAAMGGAKYSKYQTGEDCASLGDMAWLKENSAIVSHEVAKKKANPFGLFDMSGNVEEWCWDAAGDLPKTDLVDWAGLGFGDNRIAHGANFTHGAAEATVSRRKDLLSSVLLWEVGFRVVLMKGSDPRPHVQKRVVALDAAKKVVMEFALVPAGKYSVGDPEGGPAATPHDVTLTRNFWIATSETTQAQWEAVMGDHHKFTNPGPDLPAENVTWDEAAEFAKRLSKFNVHAVLPTEAEWEVACRAGTPWRWASGDAAERASEIAWHKGNSTASQPVRTRRPNALGIYDMSGNVFEWCQDWYAPYPDGALKDPEGPKDGKEKVMRGACYTDDVAGAKSGARNKFAPSGRQMNMGFRVVVR